MDFPINSMVIFYSYFKLPEGNKPLPSSSSSAGHLRSCPCFQHPLRSCVSCGAERTTEGWPWLSSWMVGDRLAVRWAVRWLSRGKTTSCNFMMTMLWHFWTFLLVVSLPNTVVVCDPSVSLNEYWIDGSQIVRPYWLQRWSVSPQNSLGGTPLLGALKQVTLDHIGHHLNSGNLKPCSSWI